MRFYDIALFTFIFNLALSMVTNTGLYNYSIQHEKEWTAEAPDVETQGLTEQTTSLVFGDFWRALQIFKDTFVNLAYPAGLLIALGVPAYIALTYQTMVILVYGSAIMQFLANRSFKAQQ